MQLFAKETRVTDTIHSPKSNQHLGHVRTVQLVTQFSIVIPSPDPRDDRELSRPVLVPRYPLGLLHQERAEALVLKLGRVPPAHGHHGPVDVQLSDDALARELGTVGLGRAVPEAQEADEDVLLGVFVGEERLPAAVGVVVASDELHVVGTNLRT